MPPPIWTHTRPIRQSFIHQATAAMLQPTVYFTRTATVLIRATTLMRITSTARIILLITQAACRAIICWIQICTATTAAAAVVRVAQAVVSLRLVRPRGPVGRTRSSQPAWSPFCIIKVIRTVCPSHRRPHCCPLTTQQTQTTNVNSPTRKAIMTCWRLPSTRAPQLPPRHTAPPIHSALTSISRPFHKYRYDFSKFE